MPIGRAILAALAMLTSALLLAAAGSAPTTDTGKTVAIDAGKASLAFGYVKPHSSHETVLTLANSLAEPIGIRKVKSECTCMTAEGVPKVIPAGGTATITVTFKAPRKPTTYRKRLLLFTDKRPPGKLIIEVTARVGLPLRVEASPLEIGELILGEVRYRNLVIANDGLAPVRPIYATSTSAAVTALVPRVTLAPGGSATVPVRVRAETAGDRATASVSLHTDCPTQSQLTVPVAYAISSAYRLSQPALDLGRMLPGTTATASFSVTAAKATPRKIVTECEAVASEFATGKATVATERRRATVTCTFTAGKTPGPVAGRVRLRLAGHADAVEVRVTATVVAPDVFVPAPAALDAKETP